MCWSGFSGDVQGLGSGRRKSDGPQATASPALLNCFEIKILTVTKHWDGAWTWERVLEKQLKKVSILKLFSGRIK